MEMKSTRRTKYTFPEKKKKSITKNKKVCVSEKKIKIRRV